MVRSQKSKRVSWPSDVNLCQIRLFLSEDSPSQVGFGAQDNLQVKASWLLHSTGVGGDDQLPPGFEGSHSTDQVEKEVPQIALVKWQLPPRFVANPHWRVVAGEESREAEFQKQREMRVLEAIYPRPSAIPPSPAVSPEVDNSHLQEDEIPLIPVTPVEDEEISATSDTTTSKDSPVISQAQPQVQTGVEPDVAAAAASAALTAIMKSTEQGNLIDQELLIKFLNNPKLIEKFVTDYGASTPQPPPLVVAPPPPPPPPVKDINYYKSLIQQHGEEKSDQQQQEHPFPQFGKNRVKRPCLYFNSSRGCKHGANCGFSHDISVQQNQNQNQNRSVVSVPEVQQSAKRMKVDRELTGRI